LKRVDDEPVWSIVCFFVERSFRRQGISSKMLQAAVDFAADRGARIVEAYPVVPKKEQAPDIYIFTGLVSIFIKAGFTEVCSRSESRPIMRFFITE
jgi:GNAT superfamily N-acetyltransferase